MAPSKHVDMELGAGLFPENRLSWLQWVLILAVCMVGYQSTETSAVHTRTENQANGDAKAPRATERVLKGLGHLGPGPLVRFSPPGWTGHTGSEFQEAVW